MDGVSQSCSLIFPAKEGIRARARFWFEGRASEKRSAENYSAKVLADSELSLKSPGLEISKNREEEATQSTQVTEVEELSYDRRIIYPEEEIRTVSYSRRRNSASGISH
jgi:hypothetical protein